MSKYIKKSQVIEAVQWNGLSTIKQVAEMLDLCTLILEPGVDSVGFILKIPTDSDSGPLVVNKGDYIILDGVRLYTLSEDKFNESYESYPSAHIAKTEDFFARPLSGGGTIKVTPTTTSITYNEGDK